MILSLGMSPIWKQYGLDETEGYKLWRACGFRYLDYEFSPDLQWGWQEDQGPDLAAGIREKLEEVGIEPVLSHVNVENPFADEKYEQMVHSAIACAGAMGIPKLVIPLGFRPGNTRKEYEERNLAYLSRVLQTAEEAGVMLLIEHAGSFAVPHYTHHAIELSRIIEKLDHHPNLKVSLNMGKMGLADIEPYTEIHLLGDLIQSVDLSDNFGSMDLAVEPERADLGLVPMMGYLNYDELMQGLKDIDYQGIMNLKLNFPHDFSRSNPYGPVKLPHMPLELTSALYRWAYKVAKYVLQTYDCYEA